MKIDNSFTFHITIISILITSISLIIDQSFLIIFEPLGWFFSFPFLILYISYRLHRKFDPKDVGMYSTLMIIGLILTIVTHYGAHGYIGNSWTGAEWLGAYIVAAVGSVISLLTLSIDVVKYYNHKKHNK